MSVTQAQREMVCAAAWVLDGTLYRWGGNEPRDGGMDCSGFVQWCLNRAGIEPWASRYPDRLDVTADRLWQELAPLESADSWPFPGDLAFYGKGGKASHVVIITKTDGATVTEVTGSSRGYRDLTNREEARQKLAWVTRYPRLDYRSDVLGIRRPYLVN